MNIGETLKEYRKAKGLTRAELAKASGLSAVSIQKYEQGERKPKIESLHRLAEVLDISTYDLLDMSLRLNGALPEKTERPNSCSRETWIESLDAMRDLLSADNFNVVPDDDRAEFVEEINSSIDMGKQIPGNDYELYYLNASIAITQKIVASIMKTLSNIQIFDIAELLSYYLNFNEEGKKLVLDMLRGLFDNGALIKKSYNPKNPYSNATDTSDLYPED
ncbi:MAG: helix-turn-helix domain-containing protein [Lachnospiraceae bacterium]|nr:helix-turn-helix domain-containing protein [Lachnospiraceae bacterium]